MVWVVLIQYIKIYNYHHRKPVNDDSKRPVHADSANNFAEAGPYRRALPQVIAKQNVLYKLIYHFSRNPQILACSAKNLLMFDLGLALGISTIVIPVLRGFQADRSDSEETIHLTATESSWYGSLVFLTQPIGSVISGWVTEQIGRKRAMLVCNIPHIIAWALLAWAGSVTELFVAGALLGLGIGLMEAPILTYVGEISHISIRGPLLAFSNFAIMIGSLVMYLLGTYFTWRTCALISLFAPIITILVLLLVPESPYWLMSQNRGDEAMASLQWLRGWVAQMSVKPEFDEISLYVDKANRCKNCIQLDRTCEHSKRYMDKAKDLLCTKAFRPLVLITFLFFVVQLNASAAIRPFLIQVFQTFGVPMDGNWATVVIGLMDLLSSCVCILTVKLIGKRNLFVYSVAISCICCTALG